MSLYYINTNLSSSNNQSTEQNINPYIHHHYHNIHQYINNQSYIINPIHNTINTYDYNQFITTFY